jgi:hypothetical protein
MQLSSINGNKSVLEDEHISAVPVSRVVHRTALAANALCPDIPPRDLLYRPSWVANKRKAVTKKPRVGTFGAAQRPGKADAKAVDARKKTREMTATSSTAAPSLAG